MAAPVRRFSSGISGVLQKTNWSPSTTVSLNKRNKPRNYFTYSPEIAQPLPREPKWTTAEEAVQCIESSKCLYQIYNFKRQNNINKLLFSSNSVFCTLSKCNTNERRYSLK